MTKFDVVIPVAVSNIEKSCVGVCLLYPEQIAETDGLSHERFADPRWRRAWQIIRRRFDEGQDIDAFLVHADLTAEGYGDAIALTVLSEAVIDCGVHVGGYAKEIRRAAMTRDVLAALGDIRLAYDRGSEGADLLGYAQEVLGDVADFTSDDSMSIADQIAERFKELSAISDARARGEDASTGIPTGIKSLDRQLSGLQYGMITVLAGRPGMCKSATALSISNHAATQGYGVHVFGMEDTRAAYIDRVLAPILDLSTQEIRRCELDAAHFSTIIAAADQMKGRNWIIDDRSALDADEIVRSVRRAAPRNKTKLVVVDYIQLCAQRRGEGETAMLTRSMKTFLAAARKDDTVWLVLSQLNREVEKRDDKRPRLSDLKMSGAIEENSKCALFLYRPGYYDASIDGSRLEINVAKFNNGPLGTVDARFDGRRMEVL